MSGNSLVFGASGAGEHLEKQENKDRKVLIADPYPGNAELFSIWVDPVADTEVAEEYSRAREMMEGDYDLVISELEWEEGDIRSSLENAGGYKIGTGSFASVEYSEDNPLKDFDIDEYWIKPINRDQMVEKLYELF